MTFQDFWSGLHAEWSTCAPQVSSREGFCAVHDFIVGRSLDLAAKPQLRIHYAAARACMLKLFRDSPPVCRGAQTRWRPRNLGFEASGSNSTAQCQYLPAWVVCGCMQELAPSFRDRGCRGWHSIYLASTGSDQSCFLNKKCMADYPWMSQRFGW